MIRRYKITSKQWIPITSAGQHGVVWVEENVRGNGYVLISHSDSGLPKSYGYKLFNQDGNKGVCSFFADNDNDIFYARNINENNSINILVDAS